MEKFEPYLTPYPEGSGSMLRLCDVGAGIASGFCCVPEIETSVWNGGGRSGFLLTDQRFGLQTITLPIVVRALPETVNALTDRTVWQTPIPNRRALLERSLRRLEQSLTGKFVLNIGDGCRYQCVLTRASEPEWIGEALCRRTYTLTGAKTLPLVTLSIGGTKAVKRFSCTSTLPKTDCILWVPKELTSFDGVNQVKLELNGLVYSTESYQGHSPTGDLILDGIEKRLTVGGVNQAGLWSWTDFPWLQPGENTLTASADGAVLSLFQCRVSYYPAFL